MTIEVTKRVTSGQPETRQSASCGKVVRGFCAKKMSPVTKWLGTALRGLRTFAYSADGQRPKVGVALGGGFARGIAHIGILRVLEENDIPVDFIAGTSVGALIASAYASGTPLDVMAEQGSATRFRDFGRWTL
jgi:predicted acylesterase/phospholipase RssA